MSSRPIVLRSADDELPPHFKTLGTGICMTYALSIDNCTKCTCMCRHKLCAELSTACTFMDRRLCFPLVTRQFVIFSTVFSPFYFFFLVFLLLLLFYSFFFPTSVGNEQLRPPFFCAGKQLEKPLAVCLFADQHTTVKERERERKKYRRNNQNRNAVIFFFFLFSSDYEQKGRIEIGWGSNCEIKSSKRAPVYF